MTVFIFRAFPLVRGRRRCRRRRCRRATRAFALLPSHELGRGRRRARSRKARERILVGGVFLARRRWTAGGRRSSLEMRSAGIPDGIQYHDGCVQSTRAGRRRLGRRSPAVRGCWRGAPRKPADQRLRPLVRIHRGGDGIVGLEILARATRAARLAARFCVWSDDRGSRRIFPGHHVRSRFQRIVSRVGVANQPSISGNRMGTNGHTRFFGGSLLLG